MNPIIYVDGAITMGYLVVALFFARFWVDSKDRLFLLFSFAFLLMALHRLAFGLVLTGAPEDKSIFYLIRFLAYLLILAGIVDKNFRRT